MIEITGKYNSAIVFSDSLEDTAEQQIEALCNQISASRSTIRVMPDVHAGAGCVIGLTMSISNAVCPNLVGVDIGCGMLGVRLNERKADLEKLDQVIRERIPSGRAVRNEPFWLAACTMLDKLRCKEHVNMDRALRSLGTLGGGNHFIELDQDEEGAFWLVVHSGSRHLGVEAARYYQEAGWRERREALKANTSELIQDFKEARQEEHIADALEVMRLFDREENGPKELTCVRGGLLDDYLHDMKIVQDFAGKNRQAISIEITTEMGLSGSELIETVHNYIDMESKILRKGAVSARKGERLLIPMNMRDGILLCEGLGNPEWNYSAPHGAGRRMSRREARERLTVEDFQREMSGVYSTTVGAGTLDESPMAYKPMEEIVRQLSPTAKVVRVLKPVYNFKAEN